MRKIIAITQLTLDGVMQSPGGPEEDQFCRTRRQKRNWFGGRNGQPKVPESDYSR